MTLQTHYKAVIIGAGHNGLVAAAYLARAGLSVLLLEKGNNVGGASISAQVFKGVDANLSRYAYLLSLFPQHIMDDLGLKVEARRRRIASFTPTLDGRALLISNTSDAQTAASFRAMTGSDEHYRSYQRLGHLTSLFAQRVFPTLTKPLMSREQMKALFEGGEALEAWDMLVERPLGESIEHMFANDLVRGSIFTDALVGTLSYGHDPTLLQNRCFIYHVIGNSTGEWRVPVGGMGSFMQQIAKRATQLGAQLVTGATVQTVNSTGQEAEITFLCNDQHRTVKADFVLSNVAPTVLLNMMGTDTTQSAREGSSFKVNMVLKRLPRLRAKSFKPEDAFNGTFHFNEGYQQLEDAYRCVMAGEMPQAPPGEVYCHTLTDSSILSPELAAQGYQTLTLFGFDMPASLFRTDNATARAEALNRYLRGINQHLEEPIESCLALDADGQPCIEAKSPLDIEADLGMPGGHIFHNDLSWPFVVDDTLVGRWGVETARPNVLICGSGALRGGGVSGIPGHNAAMAVLERTRGH